MALSPRHSLNQFTRSDTKLQGNVFMIVSTIMVVLFSPVVFGPLAKALVRILLPLTKYFASTKSSEPSILKSFVQPLLGNGHNSESHKNGKSILQPSSLPKLLSVPSHTVHHYLQKLDNAFMRPMFDGRGFVPCIPCLPTDQDDHQWL